MWQEQDLPEPASSGYSMSTPMKGEAARRGSSSGDLVSRSIRTAVEEAVEKEKFEKELVLRKLRRTASTTKPSAQVNTLRIASCSGS